MDLIAVQFDVAWEDKPANCARVRRLLAAAEIRPGSLIVLPEMFAAGFSMNVAGVGEEAGGPTETFLGELAAEHKSCVLGGVVTRAAGGRGRNEAVAFGAHGREAARYCKLHPFGCAGESDHYVAGDELVTFEWAGFTVAPLICYDLRFPETFRGAVDRGANLFAVIANWPSPRQEHWSTLLAARAIENQAYVVGVNRCGADPNCTYAGGSVIFDPRGDPVAAASGEECLVTASPDLPALDVYRREFPALADRRESL